MPEPHEIGDAVDQNRGLTASGTGKDQKRPFRCHDRLTLFGIQMGELAFDIFPAGIDILLFFRIGHIIP